jgi:hypothetical protein
MTTGHTCCGNRRSPAWGKRTVGCPRCDELAAGAEPITWAPSRAQLDREAVDRHLASERHRTGGCGIVCTFGEW